MLKNWKGQRRIGRVTYKQQELIIEALEKNPILLSKKCTPQFTKEQYNKTWANLTKILNAANYQLNAKTCDKWKKVLSSWLRKITKYDLETAKISLLDERLLTIKNNFLKSDKNLDKRENKRSDKTSESFNISSNEDVDFDSDTSSISETEPLPKKQKRANRVTCEQQQRLLEYIEENKTLLTKKFTRHLSRELYNREWKEIAMELNKLNNGRSTKTVAQWQRVLSSWVSKTKTKLTDIKRCKRTTGRGNFTQGNVSLTELEDRLLAVKGMTSVQGDGKTKEIGLSESDASDDVYIPISELEDNDLMEISPNNTEITTNQKLVGDKKQKLLICKTLPYREKDILTSVDNIRMSSMSSIQEVSKEMNEKSNFILKQILDTVTKLLLVATEILKLLKKIISN
ncbi:uncharacterized protein LOC127286125 isoform X1 [Leptopilina boulardi]|uniref:uncharacterized protein LOC127286125 isoform X1 n=1 Tax=Leptopilina boulardi TaxID=63433 RepID=UPI0021F56E1E|nr:uncharacterized protein LOC127286125 isoform X1 [Leptopilina boulardi]